jgi:hypothetical protein
MNFFFLELKKSVKFHAGLCEAEQQNPVTPCPMQTSQICVCVCVYVCVCVWERERERERECVCVCVCVSARSRVCMCVKRTRAHAHTYTHTHTHTSWISFATSKPSSCLSLIGLRTPLVLSCAMCVCVCIFEPAEVVTSWWGAWGAWCVCTFRVNGWCSGVWWWWCGCAASSSFESLSSIFFICRKRT